MDIGVLHGWPIGVSAVISAGLGILLARSASWWLADDDHAAVLVKTRLYRPLPLAILGIVLAVAAALLFPAAAAGSGTMSDAGSMSEAGSMSGAAHLADIGSVDGLLLALSLSAAAAATPFLAVVDIVVHRLPDRIVYPLIGIELLTFVLGQLLGESAIWGLGLIAGGAGVLLFGVLYLSGRVMHARTMGLGDVKLAFLVFGMPALFSPWAPALVFIIMMLIAGVAALLAAAAKRSLKATTIAFGPAMLSGMWVGSVLAPILL
ncbi:hypothetical protein GCM10009689_35970 [Brevibacterium antiquum]|uniref:hypothetical protein n=1 Tax=Brevibacterium antiquum TaxID=234835 RepID=UPI0018E01C1C|nr:hypothetical protein [Brevibacterium antiquum]